MVIKYLVQSYYTRKYAKLQGSSSFYRRKTEISMKENKW
ncbi:hypothetical protein D2M30_3231 [Bacillus amyloliquefaciens]|nr:hypothetical protein D2M30_3231 [Bacillus amyloliquefaciens]